MKNVVRHDPRHLRQNENRGNSYRCVVWLNRYVSMQLSVLWDIEDFTTYQEDTVGGEEALLGEGPIPVFIHILKILCKVHKQQACAEGQEAVHPQMWEEYQSRSQLNVCKGGRCRPQVAHKASQRNDAPCDATDEPKHLSHPINHFIKLRLM